MDSFTLQIFEAVAGAALLIDGNLCIAQANPAFRARFGYAAGQLDALSLPDLIPEAERQTVSAAFRQSGTPSPFSASLLRQDGAYISCRLQLTRLLPGSSGETPCFFVQVLDAEATSAAQQELQRWQAVFMHAGWGVVIGSADGTALEWVNPAFARMHGYAVEELTDRSILDMFAPEIRADVPVQIGLAHRQGRHQFESIHIRKDGSLFPVLIDVTVVYDAAGEVQYRIVNVQDITERKNVERRLTLKNFALDHVHEGAFLLDEQGRVNYVNDEGCRMLGYSRAELLGKQVADFDPDWPAEKWSAYWVQLRTIRTQVIETRHRAKDGREYPVEVASNYFEYEGQGYTLALVRDITERKQTEAQLQEREQRYREIFEHASDALYLLEVTEDGRYRNLAVNPEFERSTGLTSAQLVGKFTDETVASEVAEAVNAKYSRCVQARSQLEEVIELDLPHGKRFYQSTLIPVFEPETGRVHRIVGITRDVTDRMRAEEMLQKQVELEAQLARVAEVVPGVLFSFRLCADGAMGLVYASPRLEDVVGTSFVPMQALPNMHPEDLPHHIETVLQSARNLSHCQSQFRVLHPRKGEIWVESHAIPSAQADGSVLWHGFMYEITERKRAEAQEAVRLQIFERLAQGAPLEEVLKLVVRYIETARPGFLGSIMQASADGLRLEQAMTPSLPEHYSAALNGIEICEGNGSCGTAAWRGETVIAEDVQTHPFWAPYKHLAAQVGVRSCWSEPILDANGKVLGAFGIYQRQPAVPSEADMQLVHRATHLAAIAIERARTEEQLRLKEFVLDSASEAVYIMGSDFRFIYVNEQACRVLGYTREELLGMTPADIDPQVNSLDAMRAVQWRAATERTFVFETQHRRRDGTVFPVEITAVSEEFEGRKLEISLVRDMSERKLAAARLENERARLRGFFQALPDLAWLKDLEGHFLACNPLVERLFGVSEAEIVGKTDYDFVDAEQAAFFRQKDMEAIAADAPCVNEEWVTFAVDGRRALLETTKMPLRDAQGRIVGVLGVGRDITERKRAEEALASREREFRTLAENSPDNIMRYDLHGRVVYANPQMEHSIGVKPEDLIGRRPFENHNADMPASSRMYAETLMHVLESGEPGSVEIETKRPSGGLSSHQIRFVPERGENGEISGALAIGRDITERKRAEEAMRQLNTELAATLQAIPDVMLELDRNGRYLNLWAHDPGLLAAPKEAVLGRTVTEVLGPDAGRFAEAIMRETDRNGYSRGHTLRLDLPEDPRWFEYSAALKQGAQPEEDSYIMLARDVTERKRAEEALASREREFRTLAENSPDNIFRYDGSGRAIYINPAAQRSVDALPEELLGKTLVEAYPGRPEAAVYHQHLQAVLTSGGAMELEMTVPTPDGKLALHQVHLVAEKDGQGHVIGVLGIGRDISALKETEGQLRESREQLRVLTARRERAREQERKRIARELHDELGQLLTSMRMNVIMLPVIFGGAQPGFRERTQEITGMVDRMIGVVRDVVSTLRPAALEMGIVTALEWLAQEFARQTGIQSAFYATEECIALDEERAVAVFRIVQESLTNVARHSGASRVEIAIGCDEANYVLEIQDNGRGFEMSRSRKVKSFGLIGIEERAHMLQGSAEISGRPGEGVIVRIVFPVEGQMEKEQ